MLPHGKDLFLTLSGSWRQNWERDFFISPLLLMKGVGSREVDDLIYGWPFYLFCCFEMILIYSRNRL